MSFAIDQYLEVRIRQAAARLGEDADRYATALLIRGVEDDERFALGLTDDAVERLHAEIQ